MLICLEIVVPAERFPTEIGAVTNLISLNP